MFRLKYIPILLNMLLLLTSLKAGAFTVVIDAGHGGKDAGARGRVALEKNINLDIAKRLGRMLTACGDVKVIYTRTDDRFVDLHERASLANEHKADLFISLHCNSMGASTQGRERVKGVVTYVMGLDAIGENLEVAHRENSVVSMENDFSERYQAFDVNSPESHVIFELNQQRHMQQSLTMAQIIQRNMVKVAGRRDAGVHQAGFIVLAQTTMPSVLVEMDYISNPECERYMVSSKGAQTIAQAIYDSFLHYRESIK